jgi:hypothetical protein
VTTDEAKVVRAFKRFVASGYDCALFKKPLYHALARSFGFIAHFDLYGFYAVKFGDLAARRDTLRVMATDDGRSLTSIEQGLRAFVIERGLLEAVEKAFEAETESRERAELARLKAKYESVSDGAATHLYWDPVIGDDSNDGRTGSELAARLAVGREVRDPSHSSAIRWAHVIERFGESAFVMSNGKTLDIQPATDDELREFVDGVLSGRIFTSEQCEPEMLGTVFMPIALGCFAGVPREQLETIGVLYAPISEASPVAVNGYPTFFGFNVMLRQDWQRAREAIVAEAERRKNLPLPARQS